MSEKTGSQSLLGDLKRLYSSVTLSLFNQRMGQYHKDSHALANHDIASQLSSHVERLAAAEKANPTHQKQQTPAPASTEPVQANAQNTSDQGQPSRPKPSAVGRIVTALSSHLRGRSSDEIQPELSEKLKNSAWTHVHAALRYARQGDEVNAKLHAGIACNALNEAEHYMSDEACSELTAEVDKLLDQIKEQT